MYGRDGIISHGVRNDAPRHTTVETHFCRKFSNTCRAGDSLVVKSPCTMLELCMSAINSPISLATLMASGHLRLRLSPAAGSTGSISPNLARMMLQLGPFVGSILPTATATGSLLLVVGISVGRKVGLLLLSFPCRDWTARRRRPPFQVFSDGAALDMLQVNARRSDGRSDAFDLTSAVFLPTSPVPFDSFFLTAHPHTTSSCRRRLSHPVIE